MVKFKALTLMVKISLIYLLLATVSNQIVLAEEGIPEDFPVFEFEKVVIDPENMKYSPTKEFDFPTVIKAEDYFENPLGKYYMYYGPHDSPGGISLAYADSLEGPWIEYENNPIISRSWSPHYSVSHVASAHPIWIEEENKLFLYFHGENSTTRLATSEDGINFEYEKVVVTTSDFDNISEASYARVFEYTIPEKNNKYIMLLMGNNNGNRKIYLAWSNDGYEWETQRTPFISPINNGEINHRGNLSGAYYFPWKGKHYVTVHASSGNQYLVEVGENFDQEIHLGPYYKASNHYPENGRAASRSYITEGDVIYMFYEAGQRGSTKIALAKSVPEDKLHDLGTARISTKSTSLLEGNTMDLMIELRKRNGEKLDNHNVSIEYFTSDSDVVYVYDGIVYGHRAGTAEIWIEATYENITVESNRITVKVISEDDAWNLLKDDFSDYNLNWSVSKGNNTTGSITQYDGFVRLIENSIGSTGTYHYITKSNFSLPTDTYTLEIRMKVNESSTGNEFTIRYNGKAMPVYLSYDGETGRINDRLNNPTQTYEIDTSKYHTYRVIVYSDSTYDVFVEGVYIWTGNSMNASGSNLIKIGADTPATANMDIDYVKLGTGAIYPVLDLNRSLEFFYENDKLQLPLYRQLLNSLSQIEHHKNKGDLMQAQKHIMNFEKHLNNEAMGKFITENAKQILNNEAKLLLNHITK